MTWFKVDDSFHSHPRTTATSLAAIGLWTVAGTWSGDHLTDGLVPDHVVQLLCRGATELADELVATGLWKRGRGGYRFHNWSKYQPTRERVERDRKLAANRQANLRERTKGATGKKSVTRFDETEKKVDPENDDATTVADRVRRPRALPSRRDGPVTNALPVRDSAVSHTTPTRPVTTPPSPSSSTSLLAELGLNAREIDKTEEAITLAMPDARNLGAVIRALIRNGDISQYIDQARAFIAEDQPRHKGRIPEHPWQPNPERHGLECLDCPLPQDHPCHEEAKAA